MHVAPAETWYQTSRLEDDVTHIYEPFITQFYRCNIWHVRGRERDLLVDSGMGVVSLKQQVTLVTERECMAVASHTHFDHIGSHHEFSHRLVHQDEANLLSYPSRENTLAEAFVTDDIFTQLPPKPYCSCNYQVKPAPATQLLKHGDIVDLGNRYFEVLHTPGHSPGQIMLWEKATGILFSGDMIYDGPLIDDLYHSNVDDYLTSMKNILDLPVRVVHGGHFPSFDGDRYRQLIKEYLHRKG